MSQPSEQIKALKDHGLKRTPQRAAVLEYLSGNTTHPSAADVYEAVSRNMPHLSYATVYNILEALSARGFVRELTIDPDRKRFDPDTTPHNHLICLRCRAVVDIQARFDLSVDGEQTRGFEILGNHVDFYGICPSCRDGEAVQASDAHHTINRKRR